MKYLAVISVIVLFAACTDSPDSPGGTLPVVQNCRIMETESGGDTVMVAWDSLSVEVDGYRIWFSDTDPGNWSIVAQVEGTTAQHVATSTGYYCVDAIRGIDVSETQSNKANDITVVFELSDTLTVGAVNGIRFEEAQTTTGDATSADFAQDLYIAKSGDTILMYRGNTEPATYPGGSNSLLADASGRVAPAPGDAAWKNSAALNGGSGYFVELESGYFAYFLVDTVATDYVAISYSQYQPIEGLRLFNWLTF